MKNRLLRFIAAIVDESKDKHISGGSYTFNVNGILTIGDIISRKEFYEAQINSGLKDILDTARKLLSEDEKDNQKEESTINIEKIDFIYLKNAFYLNGSQKTPSDGSLYIAVEVDSINAYSVGRMEIIET